MKSKIFCFALSLIMVLASVTSVFANDNISQIVGNGNTVIFIDVPANYWAKEQIDSFTQQGIVSGYKDGSFKPNAGVTREEFCKLLVSTFNPSIESPTSSTFSDVTEDRWSYPYIEACREYLTGYSNPFGGKSAFHPNEYATREDIAVALVRMMGFTADDATDKEYALKKFKDGDKISPQLRAYVSIACENNLISGYPNGNFEPSSGITRAETVVLLNRATKQAVADIDSEIDMSASVEYSSYGKVATLNVLAEEGVYVTVNGTPVRMNPEVIDVMLVDVSKVKWNMYEGELVYEFNEEGEVKEFSIEGRRAGKTKTLKIVAKYEIDAPILKVSQCPTDSETSKITIAGTVSDKNVGAGDLRVTVNGNTTARFWEEWTYTTELKEGENVFNIVATNSLGKSTSVEKIVCFNAGGPKLTVTECPTNSDLEKVTIKGEVSDKNEKSGYISVTVNGSPAKNVSGSWTYTAELKEGENIFRIEATNSLGKTTVVTKTINFGVSGPKLLITECPSNTNVDEVTIRGTVSDKNDRSGYISVTVNGNSAVNVSGSWTYSAHLNEGENIFNIEATNTLGKTTSVTKIVNFEVSGPKLIITSCPTKSDTAEVTIQGKVSDKNDRDSDINITVNGQSASNNYGNWSKKVTLKVGENTVKIVATNSFGKSTIEKRIIDYETDTIEEVEE